jgi:ABC-type ATPase with predicted acetyltransferase domain
MPGILTNTNGELFPYMIEPANESDIICHNMAGFVFTNMESGIKDWLFDDDIAYVETDDEETIVTFTKSQKYVTVEKTYGHWWLATYPQYIIEKLT